MLIESSFFSSSSCFFFLSFWYFLLLGKDKQWRAEAKTSSLFLSISVDSSLSPPPTNSMNAWRAKSCKLANAAFLAHFPLWMCLSWFILCLQQQNDGGWPTVITHNTTQSSPTMNATDSNSQLYFTLSFSKLLGFKKYV